MKNPFLYGVLAVSLCAVNISNPVTAQETVVSSSIDFFDGKIRPKSGAKYNMRVFIRSKVTQTVPASMQQENLGFKKLETVSITKFGADYDIVSVDAQGNHQVRVTYGDFSTDINVSVDGESQPQAIRAASKKDTNEFLKVMNGVTFLIKISPRNKVLSVYGLDVMRAKLLKKFASISPETGAVAESMLSNLLSDKNAIKNFGNLGGEPPSQPIRVSESWNYSTPAAMGTGLESTSDGVRTLVSLKNGVATIKDSGTFTRKGHGKWIPKGPAMDTTGNINAITHITNATGIPLDSTVTQTMNGIILIPVDPTIMQTIDGKKTTVRANKDIQIQLSSINEIRFVLEEK